MADGRTVGRQIAMPGALPVGVALHREPFRENPFTAPASPGRADEEAQEERREQVKALLATRKDPQGCVALGYWGVQSLGTPYRRDAQ